VLGVFWRRANKWGAICGMVAGLGVCMYYMAVTYPFFRDILGVTAPIASYQWFGMNAISAGVFGVPVGLLTIWIVSLLTPAPDRAVQALVDHVRYPVLAASSPTP
jgi:cation/acetate symporter